MKSRKFWYVIALGTLCLVAAKIAVAQEQEPRRARRPRSRYPRRALQPRSKDPRQAPPASA